MEESQELLEKATRERIRKNGFMLHNHIELESVERDRAVFKLDIRPESCNPYGMVHGGALVTLADSVCGTAAFSTGRTCVTLDCSMQYLAPAKGARIFCTATPKKLGRTVQVYDAALTDETGRLVASGTYTFFAVGPADLDHIDN